MATTDKMRKMQVAKVGSGRVVAGSKSKRVDNPHCGHMIEVWVDNDTHKLWRDVLEKSGRCNIDLLKMAVEHRTWFGYLYRERPVKKDRKIALRPTLRYRDTLTQLAWDHKLSRNQWLANTVTQFLTIADIEKLIQVLRNADDITDKILNDDA
jgi:hypothetical protein